MKTLSKEIKAIYGKSSFVKIKNDAFAIEKVQCAFVKTEDGSSTENGDYYLDFGDALTLCRDIEFGVLFNEANKSKEAAATSGKRYAAPIRTYQGGTPEAKSQRKDRKAVARVFYVEPGQRAEYPIIFKYEEGPGTSNEKGLIVPDWWKEAQEHIDSGGSTFETEKGYQQQTPWVGMDPMRLSLVTGENTRQRCWDYKQFRSLSGRWDMCPES